MLRLSTWLTASAVIALAGSLLQPSAMASGPTGVGAVDEPTIEAAADSTAGAKDKGNGKDKGKKKGKRPAKGKPAGKGDGPTGDKAKAEEKKKPPVRGTAIVSVSGTVTRSPRITLTGPDSFRRVVRESERVEDLPAGSYSIEAPKIVNADGTVQAQVSNRQFRVSESRRRIKVQVQYTFTAYPQPPGPGVGLTLLERSTDSIELSWRPGLGPVVPGTVVRRAAGPLPPEAPTEGGSVPVTTTADGSLRVTDAGLAPSTQYSYSVFAPDSGGTSDAPLDTLTARTPQQTIYAAGDIGWCGGPTRLTAQLIPTGSVFLGLGDLAYFSGTRDDFRECYHPHYGRLRSTTFPTPGNHEYRTGAEGYRAYFGDRAGTRAKPWYVLRVGNWRFLMLASDCSDVGGCGPGSKQYQWIEQQLAAEPSQCLAAAWHHPHWDTGDKAKSWRPMRGIYSLLESAGADFFLTGHLHRYERFARVSANGYPNVTGIRQFVVGTGGAPLKQIDNPLPTLESVVRDYGVLRLDLDPDGYSWQFLGIGDRVLDAGQDTCG